MTAGVTARVTEVYAMLVAGLRREQILRLANDKHGWDVSWRTVDTYIAHAKKRIVQDAQVKRGVELGKALARLDSQYFKADQRKDHRGAAAIVDKHINLFHLDQPEDDDHDELRRFLDLMEGR